MSVTKQLILGAVTVGFLAASITPGAHATGDPHAQDNANPPLTRNQIEVQIADLTLKGWTGGSIKDKDDQGRNTQIVCPDSHKYLADITSRSGLGRHVPRAVRIVEEGSVGTSANHKWEEHPDKTKKNIKVLRGMEILEWTNYSLGTRWLVASMRCTSNVDEAEFLTNQMD